MCKVISVKARDIFLLIEMILKKGGSARVTITGMSMYPFLRDTKDSVELSPVSFESIQRGDIVAILRDNGQYVIHRILKKEKECFYMVGDAQQWIEGPVRKDQLVAIVTAVWRDQRRILCSNLWWKTLSTFWLILFPLRNTIIYSYSFSRKILKKIIRYKGVK